MRKPDTKMAKDFKSIIAFALVMFVFASCSSIEGPDYQYVKAPKKEAAPLRYADTKQVDADQPIQASTQSAPELKVSTPYETAVAQANAASAGTRTASAVTSNKKINRQFEKMDKQLEKITAQKESFSAKAPVNNPSLLTVLLVTLLVLIVLSVAPWGLGYLLWVCFVVLLVILLLYLLGAL
jgi:uncharacterized protein (DUF983 family)